MNTTTTAASDGKYRVYFRVACLAVLFFFQFEFLVVSLRDYFDRDSALESLWAPLFQFRFQIFSFTIVFPAALLFLAWSRRSLHLKNLVAATRHHSWPALLLCQVVSYGALLALTLAFLGNKNLILQIPSLGLLLWTVLLLACIALSLLTLVGGNFWIQLLKDEKLTILAAALMAITVTALFLLLKSQIPALAYTALQGTHALLDHLYAQIVFDPSERLIGTPDFQVIVSNACAGYEGLALMSVFLSVYLWLFRHEFRFPQVLITFPIALTIIWAFNIVRITLLIVIGDVYSPRLALAGFHSNAGWVSFLTVSVGLLWLLHRIPWFLTAKPATVEPAPQIATSGDRRVVDATLIPLATLLAAILLLGLLNTGFDVFYPVKVLLTAGVLWHFRDVYQFRGYRPDAITVAIGAVTFIVWMMLAAPSDELSALYSQQFEDWPVMLTLGWLLFRVLGSAITVPLAEELAFRGYLLARLGGNQPAINSRLPFSLFALVISSLLFGLLHASWIAGIFAGAAYGWARYRRGHTGDAVVAHMVTNALLCVYVLVTGSWSYW